MDGKSIENQGADTNGNCVVSKDSLERVYLIFAVYSNGEIEGIGLAFLMHYRWMKVVALMQQLHESVTLV
jgi:hypothetical protein